MQNFPFCGSITIRNTSYFAQDIYTQNLMRKVILLILIFSLDCYSQVHISGAQLEADILSVKDFKRSVEICDSLLTNSSLTKLEKGAIYRIKGKANYFQGYYEEAGKLYIKSISFLPDLSPELGLTLIEQAKLYRKLKMFPEAINTYTKAENIFSFLKDENNLGTVWNEWGGVYEFMGDYNTAIQYYSKSLKVKEKLKDTIGIAYANSFLSSAYLHLNDLKQAEEHGTTSIQIFRMIKDDFATALQSSDMASIYEKKNNLEQAIKHLTYSDSIAVALNYPDLLSENYRRLSNIYTKQKDYKSALFYFQKYNTIKDSLFTSNSQKNIAELHVKYQSYEKDNDILLQKNKLAKQNLYLMLSGFLVLTALIIIIFIFRTKKFKEEKLKHEAELKAELLRLENQNAIQQDRLRISRDLHDNIGANLTYIHSSIDSLQNQETEWQDMKTLVNDTISELRRTVWLINKPSVTLDEWVVKLLEYYKRVTKVLVLSKIENGNTLLIAKQATLLFRIIQEATNNSIKYSNASEVTVTVTERNKDLTISIKDEGTGFNVPDVKAGLGLSNIHYNAAEINATSSIKSKIGKGTEIKINLLLKSDTQ